VGDKRPYLVGLIVPEAEWLDAWAKAHDKEGTSLAQLGNDPALHSALRAAVDRVNAELSVTEKVRQFIIADEPFSIENQMLTPSIKIRRHMIRGVYQERLDALYKG
jgi:long-chain acyl-CoA synthetase